MPRRLVFLRERLTRELGAAVLGLAPVFVTTVVPAVERATAKLIFKRGKSAEVCPDAARLRTLVMQGLGFDPFVEKASLRVAATVARTSDEFQGTVSTLDADGQPSTQREFTGGTCEEVLETMALAIGILLEPDPGSAGLPEQHQSGAPPLNPRI